MKINNIQITPETIVNCFKKYYPKTINPIIEDSAYDMVLIFGIRVDTCDTSLPDDFLGAIRFQKSFFSDSDYWELIITEGTTDPTPKYLAQTIDRQAKLAGGTAWVKEGQYLYYLTGNYQGYPAFAPAQPIDVYRWMPKYKGETFDKSKAKLSTSPDTLIHRSWATGMKLYEDSAGCQVFKNNALLWDLKKWAKEQISMYKKNSFTYTLFTKEQFTIANEKVPEPSFFKKLYNEIKY